MKKLLVLAVALLFLIPIAGKAFAAPATNRVSAQMNRLPLKGAMQSSEIYSISLSTMVVTATGAGDATQLGQFAVSYKGEMNLLDRSLTENAYFVTPNGDSLQAQAVGQAAEERTPGVSNLIEIYTITGGTGRFTGAGGTFTLNRIINLITGGTTSTFEGTILIP